MYFMLEKGQQCTVELSNSNRKRNWKKVYTINCKKVKITNRAELFSAVLTRVTRKISDHFESSGDSNEEL